MVTVNNHLAEIAGLLSFSPDAIIVVDARGVIVATNPNTDSLFGYEPGELIGKSIEILVPHSLGARHTRYVEAYSQSPSVRGMSARNNLSAVRKDAGEFPVDVSLNPFTNDSGAFVVAAVRDRSARRDAALRERELVKEAEVAAAQKLRADELESILGELRETQSQLIQSAKLSALGEIGAGIAHELNQPLTVISGIAGLALDNLNGLPREWAKNLSVIYSEAERMAAIINNIKTFARQTADERTPLRLHEVVQRSLGLIGQQLKTNGIWVEEGRYDASLAIQGDPIVLQQVIVNLLVNARDAIQGWGGGMRRKSGLVFLRTMSLLSSRLRTAAPVSQRILGLISLTHSSPPRGSEKAQG